jgi:hypothetical protein
MGKARTKRKGPERTAAKEGARRRSRVADAPMPETRPPQQTVTTVLTGMRDLGGQVGQAAVSVVRGSIKAAGQIGADLGRLAVTVADGAIETADRIAAAAAGMITNQRSAPASVVAPRRREPFAAPARPDATPHPDDLPTSPDAYARRTEPSPSSASRKPPAPSAPRRRKRPAAKRRRGAA